MLDMAVGFGQGAQLPWSVGATKAGEDFLSKRLDDAGRDYWDPATRKAAVEKARVIGRKASDLANAGPSPKIITEVHIALALGRKILRGDCPFD